MTVPYPEYPPPGYGTPMPPYHQAPQRKSRTGLWIGLAVVVVLAIVASAATTAFLLTRKQDITELTASMLLPESEFPSLEAGEFVDEPIAEDDEYDFDPADVDPAECARRARAANAASRCSTPKRTNRSRCSTTITVASGSDTRPNVRRLPLSPDPTSQTRPAHPQRHYRWPTPSAARPAGPAPPADHGEPPAQTPPHPAESAAAVGAPESAGRPHAPQAPAMSLPETSDKQYVGSPQPIPPTPPDPHHPPEHTYTRQNTLNAQQNNPHATQATSKSATNDDEGFTIKLRINTEWPDLKKILAECDSRAIEFADMEGTVRAVDHPELPDWAVAVAMDTDEDQFVYVSGYYRGVQVDAEYFGRQHTKSDLDELVRMFNAQVDRLSEH